MNINETVKNKKHYQFAVLSSVILLAHHIILDTSVTVSINIYIYIYFFFENLKIL